MESEDGVASEGVESGDGDEAGFGEVDGECAGDEGCVAEFGELLTDSGVCPVGVVGAFVRCGEEGVDSGPVTGLAGGEREPVAFGGVGERDIEGDTPFGTERADEGGIKVAAEGLREGGGGERLIEGDMYEAVGGGSDAVDGASPVGDGESVSVVEGDAGVEPRSEESSVSAQGRAYGFAGGLGCEPVSHAGVPSVEEIVGGSAVEGLGGVGCEVEGDGVVRLFCGQETVEELAVVGGDIGDIGGVLESSFNLEGRDAGLDKLCE